jgi:hypothetical protein
VLFDIQLSLLLFQYFKGHHLEKMHSLWGKKSKEARAEKKKPRTSAAQIRVQKGKFCN